MIFSVGDDQLAVCAYVPDEKQSALSCEEWLLKVLDSQGGSIVSKAKDVCTGIVKKDADKGKFPLKIREPMILEANNFLRKKGLFPEDDSDDDEMVFGDDDFPSYDPSQENVEETEAVKEEETVKVEEKA